MFHDAGGIFHHAGTTDRVPGTHPARRSYGSFASFTDPDGNTFVVQEVTARRPGRTGHVESRTRIVESSTEPPTELRGGSDTRSA